MLVFRYKSVNFGRHTGAEAAVVAAETPALVGGLSSRCHAGFPVQIRQLWAHTGAKAAVAAAEAGSARPLQDALAAQGQGSTLLLLLYYSRA